jgi:hypothetical protein
MTSEEFGKLLSMEEGTTLDFKREHYKFLKDKAVEETASFIKDVVSLSNTIRNDSGYIVFGVGYQNGKKELVGIDISVDDAILQEKIKSKVYPRPNFNYFEIDFNNQTFGVIEVPLHKYSEPICSVVKLKGMDIGRVYHRVGSTNAEAFGRETILINDWLKSLKSTISTNERIHKATDLLSRINNESVKLSSVIPECLRFSKDVDYIELETFCRGEMKGWNPKLHDEKTLAHRVHSVVYSYHKIHSISPSNLSFNQMWEKLKEEKGFYERQFYYTESITLLETILDDFKLKGHKSYTTREIRFGDLFPDSEHPDAPFYLYSNFDIYSAVHTQIKLRLIGLLMACIE